MDQDREHEHYRTLVDATEVTAVGGLWRRLPAIGLAAGVLGTAGAFLLAGQDHQQLFYSWLVAFVFFLSIALGGLFFVLTHFASKAGWSVVVRRVAEQMMRTLPWFIVLFVPIFLGMSDIFHWTHDEVVADCDMCAKLPVKDDHLLHSKAPYLNETFFVVRAAIYFAIWTFLAWFFGRESLAQDHDGDHAHTRRMQALSGPGIALFAITVTFAAIDWIMSLDPHWYSTMFGVYYFAGCLVGGYAFMIVVLTMMRRSGMLEGTVTVEHFHDLGKLLFAMTVFWTYIAFSQFFLIWYANIPEETIWYIHRLEGSWRDVTRLLAVGHFVVPFLFLMSHRTKRNSVLLLLGAVWMLLMHGVDVYWLIMPVLHHHGAHFGLVDVAALLGVGGFFLAAFGMALRRSALVPLRDPRLPESLSFENV